MAYVTFLDPPPQSRQALNSFGPRCFGQARKRPRFWSRRCKAESLTLLDNGLYLPEHNWCYLGMISYPSRVQAIFHAIVPSESYWKCYFRRRSTMGKKCTVSIDLPLMNQKVVQDFLLEVSFFLFGMPRHNYLCARHPPSARGHHGHKMHGTGLLMDAIEG